MNITRLRPVRPVTASSVSSVKARPELCKAARLEAQTLLAEILARLHGIELPILQFMPAGMAGSGDHVSREFASAAATRFGRTLLVDASAKVGLRDKTTACHGGNRKQRRIRAITPDTEVAGLYHRQTTDMSFDLVATETPDAQPFRMIVVQSAMPAICPGSLDRARNCHGSILTVAAGITPLPELQATARQIANAGGTLLGLVLFDAPAIRLPFSVKPTA